MSTKCSVQPDGPPYTVPVMDLEGKVYTDVFQVLGRRLLMVLGSSLPLLEEQGLRSVLSQCSPGNPGLRPLYLPLLRQQAKEESGKGERETRGGEDDFAAMLLNLFITASLMLLKKTGASRSVAVGMPLRCVFHAKYMVSHLF